MSCNKGNALNIGLLKLIIKTLARGKVGSSYTRLMLLLVPLLVTANFSLVLRFTRKNVEH